MFAIHRFFSKFFIVSDFFCRFEMATTQQVKKNSEIARLFFICRFGFLRVRTFRKNIWSRQHWTLCTVVWKILLTIRLSCSTIWCSFNELKRSSFLLERTTFFVIRSIIEAFQKTEKYAFEVNFLCSENKSSIEENRFPTDRKCKRLYRNRQIIWRKWVVFRQGISTNRSNRSLSFHFEFIDRLFICLIFVFQQNFSSRSDNTALHPTVWVNVLLRVAKPHQLSVTLHVVLMSVIRHPLR